jgi:D-alanine transaminase
MPRIVYLNGHYVPYDEAKIPVMDRGFLFGDGIYEVTAVLDGKLLDNAPHLARLDRSLKEIGIPNPHTAAEWTTRQTELMRRNDFEEGLVYIEVTRGVYERDFLCPENLKPTVVMFTQPKTLRDHPLAKPGAAVITVPDLRWKRRDIKSVSLLAQVLAKQAARAANAAEAWMVEDGQVTEGASSTAFIIAHDGRILTRQLSTAVLAGVTRGAVLKLAEENNLRLELASFSVADALAAREVFYTSASTLVMPVISIDGQRVGDGRPGPLTKKLRQLYLSMAVNA